MLLRRPSSCGRALAHGRIAARRRVEPAVVAERDATLGEQAPAQVGVFTVELDPLIETADARERVATTSPFRGSSMTRTPGIAAATGSHPSS